MMTSRGTDLLRALQIAGFEMTEAALYLDVYPDCDEARKYFDECRRQYVDLAGEYEEQNGPLTHAGTADGAWNWIDGPWPWKGV